MPIDRRQYISGAKLTLSRRYSRRRDSSPLNLAPRIHGDETHQPCRRVPLCSYPPPRRQRRRLGPPRRAAAIKGKPESLAALHHPSTSRNVFPKFPRAPEPLQAAPSSSSPAEVPPPPPKSSATPQVSSSPLFDSIAPLDRTLSIPFDSLQLRAV